MPGEPRRIEFARIFYVTPVRTVSVTSEHWLAKTTDSEWNEPKAATKSLRCAALGGTKGGEKLQ
jgi:hypothetical protein